MVSAYSAVVRWAEWTYLRQRYAMVRADTAETSTSVRLMGLHAVPESRGQIATPLVSFKNERRLERCMVRASVEGAGAHALATRLSPDFPDHGLRKTILFSLFGGGCLSDQIHKAMVSSEFEIEI